jgi:transcriptional regulator with PAS, ATPase and Fis domain
MNKVTRSISRPGRQKLLSHHWPGNVRELRNVIERALILESTPEITSESLPDFQLESQLRKTETNLKPVPGESLDDMMMRMERDLISSILERNHFSLSRSADQLKISRHALRYRMQRLNISAPENDEDASAVTSKEKG